MARANRLTEVAFCGLDRTGLLLLVPKEVRKGFENDYLPGEEFARAASDPWLDEDPFADCGQKPVIMAS